MNPLYDQLFNKQYVNTSYLQQLQLHHHAEQQAEISKAVKALHDYFDAARKIEPDYQQQAFQACATAILEEMNDILNPPSYAGENGMSRSV